MKSKGKILIIGAGLMGLTLARQFKDANYFVEVREKNNFVGGQCAMQYDKSSHQWVNKFGPHIFHSDEKTWKSHEFLMKYTPLIPYQHKVMCIGNGNMIMWPPNKTYQELYSTLNPNKDVFEEFVASYSKKMWGSEFKNIYANIKDRFKFKDNYNSDFFENEDVNLLDFNNLFDNITKNLRIKLNKPQTLENIYYEMDSWDKVFVTTPIDEFFSYKLGKLDWRGITFNFKNIVSDNNILPTPVVNLNSHPEFTRITEYNQLNVNGFNSFDKIKCLCYEQPNSTDKYYPVLNKKNQALLEKYNVEAKKHSDYVHFCGRLGTFRYLDMDQTIIEAINIFKEYRKNDK